MKRYVCCALILALLASATGCARILPDPTQTISAYFAGLEARNYPSCYAMLDAASKERMTMGEYLSRHDDLYKAMGVTAMAFEPGAVRLNGDYYELPFTLKMKSGIVGDIEEHLLMRLHMEDTEFKVEWYPGMLFEGMSWDDVALVNTLSPKRGEILDSQANAYAINTYAQSIMAKVDEHTDAALIATRLSPLVSVTYNDIVKTLKSTRARTDGVAVIDALLPGTLDEDTYNAIQDIPGVYIDEGMYTSMRYYPQQTMLAHALGYVAPITKEQLKTLGEGYTEASRVGQSGLEAAYEQEMRGVAGVEIALFEKKDGVLKKKRVIARVDAQDGADLELTIDHVLQQRAEERLSALTSDEAGSIVVINPRTGDVEAMASYPTFDLNMFAFGLSKQQLAFINDPANRNPLFNRATRGLYPPGSTVKPFTAAMGLDSGLFTPQTVFTGTIVRKQWQPTEENWKITRVEDYDPPIRMENAMIHSDNIYFANIALELQWMETKKFFEGIGFAEPIEFDIPVATPRVSNEDNPTNQHLLASTGFGQGQMLVSPLQMACIFSAFANGGDIMRPRIVKALRRMEGDEYAVVRDTKPEVWKSSVVSGEDLSTITPMIRKVMSEGTGKRAAIEGTIMYGKTGTAELDGAKTREISWMIAYSGNEGYDRLVCVMLETPANSGQSRFSIMQDMMKP